MCLAVPGVVLEIEGDEPAFRRGSVDFAGIQREVSLAFTPEAKPGDYVLVHAGFALTVIDAEEARQTLDELRALGEAADAEQAGGTP